MPIDFIDFIELIWDLAQLRQHKHAEATSSFRIFQEECLADGYKMPAGCIKVALENESVKYAVAQEIQSQFKVTLLIPFDFYLTFYW